MVGQKPPFKGLMMIETVEWKPVNVGWTETVWINKSAFEDSLAALETLAECRLDLLPPGAKVVGLRVTHADFPRASLVAYPRKVGRYGTSTEILHPDMSLVLRLESGPIHISTYLAGLPRNLRDGAEDHRHISLAPLWEDAFHRYVEELKQSCVFVQRTRPEQTESNGGPASATYPITSVTPVRLTRRKRGRPFFLTRGRRR